MTYRTLLLHLDDDPRAGERLSQVARLARAFESHLIGLSCRRPPLNLDAGNGGLLGLEDQSAQAGLAHELARARESRFTERCRRLDVRSFEVTASDEDLSHALLRHARGSDLLVVGQPDASDVDHARRAEILAQVLQRQARPTLVWPYAGRFERMGDAPLVAWDDSREAARATADALPLLQRARIVHLVRFVPAEASARLDASTLLPVVRWLQRQGVKVEAREQVAATDVGDALLTCAADTSADLIVMGAWGQSRWAERLLGGATRTLLRSMTVPTFMSH